MGVSTVGRSMLGTAVPLFAVALDVAPLWVGVLVALPNALPVVLAMPAGRWVDGAGAGAWLATGLIGTASAPLLLALAPGAAALAAAQVIVGVFQLFSALAAQAYVAEASSDASLDHDYATFATLLSAGRLVGPLLVGVVIDLAGFRAAFAASGAAALAAVAMAAGLRRGEDDGHARTGDGASAASPDRDADAVPKGEAQVGSAADAVAPGDASSRFGAREAWRAAGVQLAVLASVAVFVGISVRQAFLPLVLEELGYSATQIGALLSLGAAASVAVRPAMPAIARRLGGPARTLVLAMATVAVGVGLLGVARHLAAFAILTAAAGVGTGVGLPLSIVSVARHVAPGRRGTALGLRMSSNRAAQLVAPMLVGAVIGVAGFGAGFGAVGALLAAASWAAARRVGAFERSERSG